MVTFPSCDLLSELADFLNSRRDQIVGRWTDAIRRDARIEPASTLPEPLLKDHVPSIIERLCELLRSAEISAEAIDPQSEKLAAEHGSERWRQGYKLEETLREISQLRSVLAQYVAEFESAVAETYSAEDRASARATLHGFLDELTWRSAREHVDEQQRGLRQADEGRLQLMRTVSHELRNVLNGLSLAAQTLEEEGEPDMPHVRDTLGRNVRHMRELLDNLLDYSALVSGQQKVRVSEFSATALLHGIVAAYTPMAEAKGLKLTFDVDPALRAISTDATKVKQIVSNLVSNAIKYTATGKVRVECRALDASRWSLLVRDTGVGIADEEQVQILSEFYRAERTAHLQGVGLGLAIVKRLVELLEGELVIESQPGKGSRFEVTLPMVFAARPDDTKNATRLPLRSAASITSGTSLFIA